MDDSAANLSTMYDELRRLAAVMMAREGPGQTIQATALVHEAFLKLFGTGTPPSFEDRKHFFNAAALAMRRVLIDRHRINQCEVNGGGRLREDFDGLEIPASREFSATEMDHLDRLLEELKRHNERWSEIIHLRYFLGLTIEDAAEMLGISTATVKSDWAFARAWLKHQLQLIDNRT